MVKKVVLVIDIIGLVIFILWFYTAPSYESGGACIVAISLLIGLLFVKAKKDKSPVSQKFSQRAGKNAKQYQSGRDMKIGK